MKRFLLAVAASLAVACGGSVDEGFEGLWRGTTNVSGGGGSLSYASTLLLSVEDGNLRVSQFCPDGSGSLVVEGSGRHVSWSGAATCVGSSASCSRITLTYESATLDLSDRGDVLAVSGAGSISGCGASGRLTTTFTGTK